MKLNTFILITLILFSKDLFARGEWKKGRAIHFFAHIAGDYQINKNDVVHTNDKYSYLEAPGNMGMRAGYEFMYMGKQRVFISVSLDYSYVGQRLNLGYYANEAGYTGSAYVFSDRLTFSNHYIDFKWRGGHSIKISPNHTLDLSAGLDFNFMLNGGHQDSFATSNIIDGKYKEPVAYYATGWGATTQGNNEVESIFPNLRGTGQAAIRFLEPAIFNDRSLKLGIDVSYYIAGDMNNTAEATFYGRDRNVLNTSTFTDRHFAIGLSVGVEL